MKENIFLTQEIGSIRKPNWALKALRDKNSTVEDNLITRNDLALLNIYLFEKYGLDIIYDGETRRIEMYEHPIRNVKGFTFTGKIRSWDNKYYRKARCIEKVGYINNFHLDEFLFVKQNAKKEIKIPITGPYTLADWSYNEYYKDKREFLLEISREIVRPLIKNLIKNGAKRIQIDEPAATTHPGEMDIFIESINESIKGLNCHFGIHICYSGNNYRSLVPAMLDLKIDQFLLEFANRDTKLQGLEDEKRIGYSSLKLFKEHNYSGEIGLGVVDVHTDEIESSALVKDRILYANKIIDDPTKIYINPDCGLRTRSRETSFNKIKALIDGAKLARESINR